MNQMGARRAQRETTNFELREDEWVVIRQTLGADPEVASQKWNGARQFLDAVLWVAMHRASWGRLPPIYGTERAIYVRFTRWAQDGTLDKVARAMDGSPEKQRALDELQRFYTLNSAVINGWKCGMPKDRLRIESRI